MELEIKNKLADDKATIKMEIMYKIRCKFKVTLNTTITDYKIQKEIKENLEGFYNVN